MVWGVHLWVVVGVKEDYGICTDEVYPETTRFGTYKITLVG